jgi:hypothetical protein
MYRKHGWRLAKVFMAPIALAELRARATSDDLIYEGTFVQESLIDAMWVTRPADGGREAWELRQVGEPFALFELFEVDEEEEDREDVRREMEARLFERASPADKV